MSLREREEIQKVLYCVQWRRFVLRQSRRRPCGDLVVRVSRFKKAVYREFAGCFEEVLLPTGKLCRDTLESANHKMIELGDSATWSQFVIFHLSVFIVQTHQEAILLVGHGLSSGAVKVLRGMLEALVAARYFVQNSAEVEDYRDYYKG
jgi:hypothetical protein